LRQAVEREGAATEHRQKMEREYEELLGKLGESDR
jgi:hypothetical protein